MQLLILGFSYLNDPRPKSLGGFKIMSDWDGLDWIFKY